ncbi:coenzyme F390 synthetase [Lacrimispora amygdalina]|nr:F390 synthetase-related protein [Clostridium indicum]
MTHNKFRIIFSYLKYRNSKKFRSREAIHKYQKKEIKNLLKHIKKYSLYYRTILKDNDNLFSLPIINKSVMMENFDELVCVDIKKEEALKFAVSAEKGRNFNNKLNGLTVGLSSGTSGHQGIFIASQKEADIWTGAILGRFLPYTIGKQEIAFFLRANSTLYENVKTRKISFTYYDIYKPLEQHIHNLNQSNTSILIAPPSVLILLAEAVQEGKLHMNLKKVISVAEVLEKTDEEYFKSVFGQNVIHQVYQCTEGFLGFTCEYGTLHINEDIVFIEEEKIDENRFIPVITDFTRRSQPIVRYRLNDVLLHKKEKCPCGSHFMALEKIEGREDDVFIFENKNGNDTKVFSDIISRCILYVNGIKQYQVIQENKKAIRILLEYEKNIDQQSVQKQIKTEFSNTLSRLGCMDIDMTFDRYTHTTDKKLKRVIRL